MHRCLISFGANLGDPQSTILAASNRLRELLHSSGGQFRMSQFVRTPPIGGPVGQPPFVNAVAAVETDCNAWEIWQAVRKTEQDFGRQRTLRWEARRIDIDILLVDQERIWTPQLKIPHPRMCMRRFILTPAAEVGGDWMDPVSGRSISQLLQNLDEAPASLAMLGEGPHSHSSILHDVCRSAGATFQEATNSGSDKVGRWLVDLHTQPTNAITSHPRLVVWWSNQSVADGAQWEDQFAATAAKLGLREPSQASDLGLGTGEESQTPADAWMDWAHQASIPRYLLATDDPKWAVHELTAALDAMDCPVELVEDRPKLRPRSADSHKGSFGRGLLVGGSRGMAGAIGLSAMAAVRSGAGLVRAAIPSVCLETVAGYSPCYTTVPLDEDDDGRITDSNRTLELLGDLTSQATAIGIGPGLGVSAELSRLLRTWLPDATPSIVLDADALNCIASPHFFTMRSGSVFDQDANSQLREWWRNLRGRTVLTPHPGEWERLTGVSAKDRESQVAEADRVAAEYELIIVLKGARTHISNGISPVVNSTGTPAMATGGSGDVLTGLIVALICQGFDVFEAAQLGVRAHGLAGELAERELGSHVVLPLELIEFLPAGLKIA